MKERLFTFASLNDWRAAATDLFDWARQMYGTLPARIVCIDAKGRICVSGKEFQRAHAEGAFPVTAYEI